MRIIAGSARGRSIEATRGNKTRPTLDRVREAIFGMLQFDIEDAIVLDLFAGSGAIGIEALSRGARKAVFCDSDRTACETIEKNLAALGFEQYAQLYFSDCFSLMERQRNKGEMFSIVFIDPPYQAGLYEKTLNALMDSGILENECIIVIEHPKRMTIEVDDSRLRRCKPHSYGDVAVTKLIYKKT